VSVLVGKLRDNPNVSIPEWWTKSHLKDLLGRDISDDDIERFDWDDSVQFVESAVGRNRVRWSLRTEGAVRFVEALLLRSHPRWEGFLRGSEVSGRAL
jgi:hypothetical protein